MSWLHLHVIVTTDVFLCCFHNRCASSMQTNAAQVIEVMYSKDEVQEACAAALDIWDTRSIALAMVPIALRKFTRRIKILKLL